MNISLLIKKKKPMQKDISNYVKTRYTAKKYDPNKKISAENIKKIKEMLRLAPSSTNSQPWHFIITSSKEEKEKIAKSTKNYPFNTKAILDASHVIVFCSRNEIDEKYLRKVLEQEDQDGRYNKHPEMKEKMHAGRSGFVNLHKDRFKDLPHWVDKQVYLNSGAFLLGVAALGIDATAMEGFDMEILDEEFNLKEKGYRSILVIPIGYHNPETDSNAKRPKSRLKLSEVLTEV